MIYARCVRRTLTEKLQIIGEEISFGITSSDEIASELKKQIEKLLAIRDVSPSMGLS